MEKYYGRLLQKNEFDSLVKHHPEVIEKADFVKLSSMSETSSSTIKCSRCGSVHKKVSVLLPVGSFYCPTCIQLGRIRSDEPLYHFPQHAFPKRSALNWNGKLTSAQQKISDKLVKKVEASEAVLVQAVTGAGKTEMIYQAINHVLSKGGAIALASPRIDVCIELHNRLTRDFSCPISLLHHKSLPYFRTPLLIATTHQLLRFRAAFDLLIIDEVDAFPFVDNDMLYFAAKNARKTESALIYLTATSTEKLDQKVKTKALEKLVLANRFHGNPLSIPKFLWESHFFKAFKKQRLTKNPLLIFVPEIEYGKQFTKELQRKWPDESFSFAASTTKNRLEIVENFRNTKNSILITTTILERGVTFPQIDVFVIQAAHQNFTKSSLIQIAGRVGRSKERPDGLVYFFHNGKSKAMIQARKEILYLNHLGENNELSAL